MKGSSETCWVNVAVIRGYELVDEGEVPVIPKSVHHAANYTDVLFGHRISSFRKACITEGAELEPRRKGHFFGCGRVGISCPRPRKIASANCESEGRGQRL